MEDFDEPVDPTLMYVESICNLADALKANTNGQVRARLLQAMDYVIIKLAPPAVPQRSSSVIDVTGR